MLVALPSAIAFGVLVHTAISPERASEGALAGMVGAAVLGVMAPLVGRNGGFITAPCAPAAAVMSALAMQLAGGGAGAPGRIVALLGLAGLIAALLQVLYGAVRAGQLIKYIPYQVVSGYLSGVALIIALGQLPKLFGLPKDVALLHGLLSPQVWNWTGIVVGAITIAAMLGAPRVTQRIPAAILGLLAGVAAYFTLALFNAELLMLEGNSLVIGPIQVAGTLADAASTRFATLAELRMQDVSLVLVSALTLSVLLSIDTLKTGVVLDALARRRHNSNRELLGQGVANAAASLAGGMPGAATMGATLMNFTSGGRTLWSGVTEGALVVLVFVLLGGLVAWVPIGALAGLLLVVAWRMFDRDMFRLAMHPSTRVDFGVIATVVIVAQVGLIAASVVGICLAILLFIREQIRGSVIINKLDLCGVRSKRRRRTAENELLDRHGRQAMVVQLQGDLFFGTTDQFFTELEQDLATLRYLLVDLRRVQSMDFTAAHLFEQIKERLEERGGNLLFSGMPSSVPTRSDIENYLAQLGLLHRGAGIRIFDTRDSAIEWMEDRILEAAGSPPREDGHAFGLHEFEIFQGIDLAAIAELAAAVNELSVPAGGRICAQGDEGDEIFLVRRGRVHALLPLEGGKRHHLATFCRGDFFGEIAFLDRGRRSADVEAATAAELYVLSRGRFEALVQSNPALAGRIFEQLALALSKRLRVADGELRALEER